MGCEGERQSMRVACEQIWKQLDAGWPVNPLRLQQSLEDCASFCGDELREHMRRQHAMFPSGDLRVCDCFSGCAA